MIGGRGWLHFAIEDILGVDIVAIRLLVDRVFAFNRGAAQCCAAKNAARILVNDDVPVFEIGR